VRLGAGLDALKKKHFPLLTGIEPRLLNSQPSGFVSVRRREK